MAKVLYGCDMSHYQLEAVFQAALNDPNIDFIILKSTEGKTYRDPTFYERAKKVLSAGKYLGAYHYCRPENNNTVEDEVHNFIGTCQSVVPLDKMWLFLDVEGDALKFSSWVESFLVTVKTRYGHNIGLYSSVSHLNYELKPIAQSGKYPIWVAHYNHKDDTPVSGCVHFEGEAVFQRTSTPYDLDTCLVEWGGKTSSEQTSTGQDMEAKINAVLEGIRPVLEKYMD